MADMQGVQVTVVNNELSDRYWHVAAGLEGQMRVDSVEKVGLSFHDRKVHAEFKIRESRRRLGTSI